MKLQAPEGTSSISIEGEAFDMATDGTVDVSSTKTSRMLCDSFGFTVHGGKPAVASDKPPADKFTDMSRAEIIGYIKGKGLAVVPATETEMLRAQARTQYSPAERIADAAALADKSKG
jgi:hypothetical protein